MQPARVRLALLLVLTAAPPAAEAAMMTAVGYLFTRAMTPQASAIWPYSVFHDLRWVLVYHNGWLGFAAALVGVVVVRGLLCAGYVALAWPQERPRPAFRRLVERSMLFTMAMVVILLPWAALDVVTAEFSLATIFFGLLVPVVILAAFVLPGGIVRGWWHGLPPLRLIGWTLVNFVALTVGGVLVAATPALWAALTAGVMGAVNGLLWQRLVRADVRQERIRWRLVPVAPLVAVLAVVGLVVADRAALRSQTDTLPPSPELSRVRHIVIFIAGHESAFAGDPAPPAGPVLRFSYRGLDADGRPRPYSAVDTYQSIPNSARLLGEQVARVHATTGRPVAIVGESEGAMIVRYYLSHGPHPAVDSAALVSPLVRAGRAYYPPRGANTGWGIGTGWLLRGLFWTAGHDADAPFLRSLLDNAPLYRNQMLCPVPGVRMIAFLPAIDTLALPPPPGSTQIALVEVAATHGRLIGEPAMSRMLAAFLNGDLTPGPPPRRARAFSLAATAWQAPALPVRLNPTWRAQTTADVVLQPIGPRRSRCPS
ncbi:hypothetical protein E1258_05185 [Micromonospora sp. KC207]|uniref:esterase/lipase family protein n=1 Tax=Micromonospora sp. KC207 TaxID=2530377 RepID=UPI001045E0D6|nr:hypothetical protein [Micromonospora sp. KC207]TDC65554.1 hypothetical protein E1258_05185 [Micromonospora sp. KC207]